MPLPLGSVGRSTAVGGSDLIVMLLAGRLGPIDDRTLRVRRLLARIGGFESGVPSDEHADRQTEDRTGDRRRSDRTDPIEPPKTDSSAEDEPAHEADSCSHDEARTDPLMETFLFWRFQRLAEIGIWLAHGCP